MVRAESTGRAAPAAHRKYTQMAAASVLSTLPALVLLLLGQRYIVKGLTAGALR